MDHDARRRYEAFREQSRHYKLRLPIGPSC